MLLSGLGFPCLKMSLHDEALHSLRVELCNSRDTFYVLSCIRSSYHVLYLLFNTRLPFYYLAEQKQA